MYEIQTDELQLSQAENKLLDALNNPLKETKLKNKKLK